MKNNKILLTIPLITTPFFLSSCVSQKAYDNSKKEIKKAHEENQKLKYKIEDIQNEKRNKIEELKRNLERAQKEVEYWKKDWDIKHERQYQELLQEIGQQKYEIEVLNHIKERYENKDKLVEELVDLEAENKRLKHEIETNEEHNRKIKELKEEIEQLKLDNKRKKLELEKLGIKN